LHAIKKPGCGQAVVGYFTAASSSSSMKVDRKGKGREYPPAPVVDATPLSSSPPQMDERTHQKILVIGDRVMTDVLLANRINRLNPTLSEQGLQAIPILTTTVWQMEGLGSRIMRALEGFILKRAMKYYGKARRQDVLEEWKDCIRVEEEVTVKETVQPAPTIRERLLGILSSLTRPVKVFIGTRRERIGAVLEGFVTEAKQLQFGFRFPEGVRRVRLLRSIVEGSPSGTLGYRK
jgi:hypothetical protein